MTDEAKRKRREYHRAYYAAHREQHKKTMEKYWEKKARAEMGTSTPPSEPSTTNNSIGEP